MRLNWFLSHTVRQATQLHRHVRKLLNAQRDLLARPAIQAVDNSLRETEQGIAANVPRETLLAQMAALEETAVKWLKPYPNAGLRENIEVLLVAIAVAMGIRTFFLQPFKIPTGSMQPTLYGITHENLVDDPDAQIPGTVSRFVQFWVKGIGYTHKVAKADGQIHDIQPPKRFLLFNLWQDFMVGTESYKVWFPPENLFLRAGLMDNFGMLSSRVFHKGDDIIKIRVISGDHLFVDRLTYNFRRPERGEIVVFETEGIPTLPQDQYYIKRLIGLSDEKVQIRDDRHVMIDGKRLDASTPHFALVYSFNNPPQDSHYSGHLNETVSRQFGYHNLSPQFPNQDFTFKIRPDHYLVLGDNTVSSADSRTWGDYSRKNVIGKAYFVYWPIGAQDQRSSRFGWGYR